MGFFFYCFCSINFSRMLKVLALFCRRQKLSPFIRGCKGRGQMLSFQGLKMDLICMRSGVEVFHIGGPTRVPRPATHSSSSPPPSLSVSASYFCFVATWRVKCCHKAGNVLTNGARQTTEVTQFTSRPDRPAASEAGGPSSLLRVNHTQNRHHLEVQCCPKSKCQLRRLQKRYFPFPFVRLQI